MYIAPNTTIKLYSGIPLDNTYDHTLYFETLSDQNAYFHSGTLHKYSLPVNTYQRVEKGKMRIAKKADDIYDCNYLAFQNTNFGNKWFYAFITGVEYINNETSEITFEIDSMQTYFFDVHLKQCFVEREHSATDEIGDNIQPEPVELGEYIISDYGLAFQLSDLAFIVAIVDENATGGQVYDGIFGGADLWAFAESDVASLKAKLLQYTQQPEQIIAIYVCPKLAIHPSGTPITVGGEHLQTTSLGLKYNAVLNSLSQESNDFGGYVPKNNKLYTYPYNYLSIDNAKGQSLALRYEFFDNFTPVLDITTNITMPVQVVARPCSYKGLPSYDSLAGYTASKTESISLDNYPVCSWANDAYSRWASQKAIPLLLSGISKTIGGGVAFGGIGGAIGLGNSIISTITQQYEASIKADECRGNISDASINVANRYQNFYKSRTHITKDYAITIDQFFTRFGYATNRVKIPYRRSRPHWNYVKTKGCNVRGLAPVDDIKKICSIYDKGITFWHTPSEVGDYSYNNDPVVTP